jgi:hypothetical protein
MPPSASSEDTAHHAKPYVVVSEIGRGSFATVYKGYHEVRIDEP